MDFHKEVELLAPVGSWDHLTAAVENGCDAVYLGGTEFNARQSAANFTLEQLKEAIEFCHIRGVKVYVTVNTLYKDKEVPRFMEFIEKLYFMGADALIVQDLGVALLIRKYFPEFPLHGSTQMTIHNLEGVNFLESLGFSRVVLSRELSLVEIAEITKNSNTEIECFVHGALCICYSGQCLMSSMIGGRSGNRGRCAQPCRLPYSLVDLEKGKVVSEYVEEKHLLSPKDLNTLKIIPNIIKAGVYSFKMEGRLKRPEYTALVTRIYRKYIDLYLKSPENYKIDAEDEEQITQIFNRGGFTTGYYEKKQGRNLMTFESPKNWGILIGKVVSYNSKTKVCEIRIQGNLQSGDGIEIWTKKKPFPSMIISSFDGLGKIIKLKILGEITKGDLVYKVSDIELLENIRKTYKNSKETRKIPVYASIKVGLNQPMELVLWDENHNIVYEKSIVSPEKSLNNSITQDKIRQQISKMGNTPFQSMNMEVNLEEGVSIPVAKINELRRNAVENLIEIRKNRVVEERKNTQLIGYSLELPSYEKRKSKLSVFCKNPMYIKEILDIGVDRIYLEKNLIEEDLVHQIMNHPKRQNTEFIVAFPRISRGAEMKKIASWIQEIEKSCMDGYLISNLGQMELLKSTKKKKYTEFSLNAFNSYSVMALESFGVEGITLSPELNLKEISFLSKKNKVRKEVLVYGYLPLMITEYCVLDAIEQKKNSHCSKACANEIYYGLLDRKGMTFPVIVDGRNCTSEILNSQPLFVLEHLQDILKTECDIRIQFSIERKREALEIISAYKSIMDKKDPSPYNLLIEHMHRQGFTKGHFYRGVE